MVKKIKNCSKKNIIFLVLTIVMFLGISLASVYFLYFFNDQRENSLTTGLISIDFNEGTEVINLENTVPVLDEVGLQNTPYEFTVKNTSKIPINLKIQLEVQSETTIPLGAVKYAFYIDNELKIIDNIKTNEDGSLYIHTNFPTQKTVNCKLIFWVDYYYENPGETFSAKVKVTGESFDIIAPESGSETMLKAINSNTDESCNPIVEEDGIIYFSGDNECVDFNYVWYSGKLWRVTAIYPDGTMKMITEDNITTIAYGEDYNFYTDESTTSWIYQWLNEDFLDTLVNSENIIKTDSTWNVTSGNGRIDTKLEETTMVPAKIGVLNSYEYYMSYKNTSYSKGYLNIGYYWWLSNPYYSDSSPYVWNANDYGIGNSPSEIASGVRPVINLQSTIQLFEGTGTKINPYRIKGDKEKIESNRTLLNTRSSGEYVNFDGETYRIVGIENDTTKINKVDYVRDDSDTIITKYLASSTTFGKDTNAQNEDYWDYYLNNTWYNSISANYKSMLEKGTYYLGTVNSPYNYKKAICDTTSNTIATKECAKTSTTYYGYVGLPRYGEMFSSQLGSGSSTSSNMWLITMYSEGYIWGVYDDYAYNTPSKYMLASRPSINLKSEIVIKSGSGTKEDPFVVGLPN